MRTSVLYSLTGFTITGEGPLCCPFDSSRCVGPTCFGWALGGYYGYLFIRLCHMLFDLRFVSFVGFNLGLEWVLYGIGPLRTCWEFFFFFGHKGGHFSRFFWTLLG